MPQYKFGAYILDTEQYQLYCGGMQVQLEPKVFDVLVYLIEAHDRVVPRDELRTLGDTYRGDAAVYDLIRDARQAVGDCGKQKQIIKTVYTRGYQFVAPVTKVEESAIGVAQQTVLDPDKATPDDASINHATLQLYHYLDDRRVLFESWEYEHIGTVIDSVKEIRNHLRLGLCSPCS